MRHYFTTSLLFIVIALMIAPTLAYAYGNTGYPGGAFQVAQYQVGEDTGTSPPPDSATPPQPSSSASDTGPVRLAWFSYLQGNVTWRNSDADSWSAATVNLPLRQGAQIWVTNGGRAEVQFDDGSFLRLGNGSVAVLQSLYSDADGEFTEIKLNEGLSSLTLRHGNSIYQVDTPFVSVKSDGPSTVRVGVDNTVEIAVRSGRATVQGASGDVALKSGDYLDLTDPNAPYDISAVPNPDSWDSWNDDRDNLLANSQSAQHLPPNIALVSSDLDTYGTWQMDPTYGWVWSPRVYEANWRPYWHGHWVYCDPFGWTWVGSEPWGWAPYHYGTWVHRPFGWAWVPGPATQYWSPAVVSFSEYNGRVGWVALAPGEVVYPSMLSVGFIGGDWSLFFSIGGAAVYYPFNDHLCYARPWGNGAINRFAFGTGGVVNRNVYVTNNRFIPSNAKNAGVSSVSVGAFGGREAYRAEPAAATSFFTRGRAIGAPVSGAPHAGPIAPHVTSASRVPSRTYLPTRTPDAQVLRRPTFSPPASTAVQRNMSAITRVSPPSSSYVTRPSQSTAPVVNQRARDAARAARETLSRTPRPSSANMNNSRSRPYRYPESSTIDSRPWSNRSSSSRSSSGNGHSSGGSSRDDRGR